jgi:hypothetical protein
MRSLITAAIPVALLAFPSLASAETTSAPVAKTRTDAGGYSYEFTDDGLLGGTNSAYSTTITGSRRVPRNLLIRPRTQFVTEMLKSVEVL